MRAFGACCGNVCGICRWRGYELSQADAETVCATPCPIVFFFHTTTVNVSTSGGKVTAVLQQLLVLRKEMCCQ